MFAFIKSVFVAIDSLHIRLAGIATRNGDTVMKFFKNEKYDQNNHIRLFAGIGLFASLILAPVPTILFGALALYLDDHTPESAWVLVVSALIFAGSFPAAIAVGILSYAIQTVRSM